MYNAFAHTSDHQTHRSTSPQEEFVGLLRKAKQEKIDLIALGGDLINYPSPKTVAWVLQQLHNEAGDIPFIYTAGNHDWHEEGLAADTSYDSSRHAQLNTTLRPLFEHSVATAQGGPGAGRLYGKTSVRGTDVVFVDNSNYQVNQEQLSFLEKELERDSADPMVLLAHIPLKMKSTPPLAPKYVCGHPEWGAATDENYEVEGRPQWPEDGNSASTLAFIDLVQKHSAPDGRIVALLTGHVHKDFSAKLQDGSLPYAANLTALTCLDGALVCHLSSAKDGEKAKAVGALQYTSLDAAEGGYRLLDIHQNRHVPGLVRHKAELLAEAT
jgi:DNA repair exonuclease SbcCD nuclease subunit